MKKNILSSICCSVIFILILSIENTFALPDTAHEQLTEMSSDIKYNLKESEDNGLQKAMKNHPKGYQDGFRKSLSTSNVSQDYPPNSTMGAQHYFDPTTGKGMWGIFPSAKSRANDLYKGALRTYCYSLPRGLVPPSWPWEVFAQSLHLMQDMTTPAHTIIRDHALGDSFEKYVEKNWQQWDPGTPEEAFGGI